MAFDLVKYLENQKKQPVDCNGTLLSVGDVVHDRWGYDLIVSIDEAGCYFGKLVCEPTHSCANIPYCLNTKDITKIEDTMYMVSVVIKNITAEEYASQYDGNEETPEIMSEYEDIFVGESFNVFNAYFSKRFNSLYEAKKEFERHSSYHESENGDAVNIRETRDTISRDTAYRQETILCNDGHDITITLEKIS